MPINILKMFCLSFCCIYAVSPMLVLAHEAPQMVTPAYEYKISNVPEKKMATIIVEYAPGAKTPSHRHGQAFVVAYVLEGAIRSQVDDEEPKVYQTGESWTENPGAHHVMSENASSTEPAKLLATFVTDIEATDLVILDKGELQQ